MTITKQKNDATLIVSLEGRLDTTTSPELETELQNSLDGIYELIFDFKELTYISSAGLRVVLGAQKLMNKIAGDLVVRHVNETIMEIFEVTGFVDILTIEE